MIWTDFLRRGFRGAAEGRRGFRGAAKVKLSRILEIFLAALALIVLAAAGLNWAMNILVHRRPEVETPALVGRPLVRALEEASRRGLALALEGREPSEEFPADAVLRQRPRAGMRVREGKILRVTLSSGGEVLFVPALAGLPLRTAELELRRAGLQLGEVRKAYSLSIEEGRVKAEEPPADSVVQPGAFIHLTVSQGPPPPGIVLVPEFVNRPISEAQQWAAAAGVKLVVEADPLARAPEGIVLEQTPEPDSTLPAEGEVKLRVKQGS